MAQSKIDKETLLKELQNNPNVHKFFAGYEEETVQKFLERYAERKSRVLDEADYLRDSENENDEYFQSTAEDYYWIIAQKKLFNLQCLWRAGLKELPVDTTFDFRYWGNNIKNCPFIDDVTEEEIQGMINYLDNANYLDEINHPLDWQDYEEFKDYDASAPSDEYPGWYHFYDLRFGTSSLILLPDLKYEDESRHLAAWNHKHIGPEQQEKIGRSAMFINTEDFIREVEPKKIQYLFELSDTLEKKKSFANQLSYFLEILENEGNIWIPEGQYPNCMFRALFLLTASKLRTLLPQVHQCHLDQKAMGISYPVSRHAGYGISQDMKARIEEGKRLLGES